MEKQEYTASDFSFEYNYNSWSLIYLNAAYTIGKDIANNLYLPQIPPLNSGIGFKITQFNYQLDISAKFFAAQNKIAEGEINTPGYGYFDLFIQLPSFNINFADCRILGGIQNITNKSYINHLSTNRGFVKEEPGRNFYLKLNISW